jgi:transforming growth factor-beta-induced protein
MIRTRWSAVAAAGLLLAGTAMAVPSASAQRAAVAQRDIVDTAVAAGSFSTLASALQAAGLVETLKGRGPFTVFAPTDAAFAKLPSGTVQALLRPENRPALTQVLTYHVAAGRVSASQVARLRNVTTLNGATVPVSAFGGKVRLATASVTTADVRATNGIIHVIDTVLLPPGFQVPAAPAPAPGTIVDVAVANGSFRTLAAALAAAGLVDTLKGSGPFTVFAPTDAAFAKLPAGTVDNLLKPENRSQLTAILTYHVVAGRVPASEVVRLNAAKTLNGADVRVQVSGSSVRVNEANVVTTDVAASNGIIHVIDSVLLPPPAPGTAAPAIAPVANNIVEVATRDGRFTNLVAALKAANLTSTLSGPGNFTVFAPIDSAFEVLPTSVVADLLKPENQATLRSVLTLHVAGTRLGSAQLAGLPGHVVPTLQGGNLGITFRAGGVFIGNARVLITDIPAGNGVIHVIDTVLLPR